MDSLMQNGLTANQTKHTKNHGSFFWTNPFARPLNNRELASLFMTAIIHLKMFSVSKYESACHKYHKLWKTSDDVLYDLCKQFPDHKNRAGTNAKLWVIGRAYATGIERQIKSDGKQSSSMEQLTNCIWRNRFVVDKILKNLKSAREPLNENKLKTIVQSHWRLLQIVKKVTRRTHTPRSFVSKYLHFHNPAVSIYDMVADTALRRILPLKKRYKIFPLLKGTDKNYGHFMFRFWQLYQQSPKPRKKGSVKLLDTYLLELAREKQILKG
jgi:hypothetical protein